MSESSEDKTRRKFAKHLLHPRWIYQYSFFYDDPADSKSLLDDQKLFRQELRRKFPDQPFLVRVQTLKRPGREFQAYLTIYTTQKTECVFEVSDRYFSAPVNVLYRQLTERRREVKANKILTQKPHDLTKLFGKVRIRRYGIINKNLLEDSESDQEVDTN